MLGVLSLTGCARSDALGRGRCACMALYQQRDPAPCEQIYMPQGKAQGFSVLQTRVIPIISFWCRRRRFPALKGRCRWPERRTDYFGYAWLMRYRLAAEYGGRCRTTGWAWRSTPAYGRSQNQLHIHLTCLREGCAAPAAGGTPLHTGTMAPLPDKLARTPTMPAA
ncbi:CDP-diacylglycerol diphosphatase [Serratia ureilytica]